MPDPEQPNDPAARTPTGELINQDPSLIPLADPANPSGTPTPPEPPKEPEAKPPIKAEGAPDKYEDFKLPDGITIEPEVLTKATELFKARGLDQAGAQEFVDFHVAQLKAATDAPSKAFETMLTDWRAKQAADPDIGPKAAAIRADIGKGFAGMIASAGELGPKVAAEVAEFKAAMDLTGVGDHPAFIKVLNRALSKFIEPSHVNGGGPAPVTPPGAGPKSVANALYPNLS